MSALNKLILMMSLALAPMAIGCGDDDTKADVKSDTRTDSIVTPPLDVASDVADRADQADGNG